MKLYVYAPSDAIIKHSDLLDRLQQRFDLRGVIIRSAEPRAFELVRQRGLEALWLAPGLWGHVIPEETKRAVFQPVPQWDEEQYPAYEAQFPMQCANTPGLAKTNAAAYAKTVQSLGAAGVFGTHLRYHHPADLAHLWGCTCDHCREKGHAEVDFDAFPRFTGALSEALRKQPIEHWPEASEADDVHPLVGWWAAVTEMEFPLRWFAWKNATIGDYLTRLKAQFEEAAPDQLFITNSFEPLLAALTGNGPHTQRASAWHAPLLGYWPHHVYQSLKNLAAWHATISEQNRVDDILQTLATILDIRDALNDPAAEIRHQVRRGATHAVMLEHDYYPVLNGTMANQYGGTADQFAISEGIALAKTLGASGIIAQGISQLLDDPALDFWY